MTPRTLTLRLYAHPDTPARVEGASLGCDARGWDYQTGDTVRVDGADYTLTVYSPVHTDDVRSNYLLADASEVLS